MRLLALAVTAFAALLLYGVPVSAQIAKIAVEAFFINPPGPIITSCPVTITITGGIEATGSGTMGIPQYQWLRNGAAVGQPQATVFHALGLSSVTDTWTVGASGTYSDALRLTWPQGNGPPGNSLTSNPATFRLICPVHTLNGKFEPGSIIISPQAATVVATPAPPPGYSWPLTLTVPVKLSSANFPAGYSPVLVCTLYKSVPVASVRAPLPYSTPNGIVSYQGIMVVTMTGTTQPPAAGDQIQCFVDATRIPGKTSYPTYPPWTNTASVSITLPNATGIPPKSGWRIQMPPLIQGSF